MPRSLLTSLAWNTAGIFLTLSLPLIIFLRHNGYGLLRPEVLIIHGLNLGAALVLGLAMTGGRTAGRVIVPTLLAVLVVDVQTDWITAWGLRLLLNVLAFSVLFWFIRRPLPRVIVTLAGVMVVASLIAPGGQPVHRTGEPWEAPAGEEGPPFLLHVVLDEHIGIEGIPPRFDADGAVAGRVRNSYLDRGFRVYGRAYSSYYSTSHSLPNLLNFTVSDDPAAHLPGRFVQGTRVSSNRWFDLLRDRGYRIHVIQPEYLTYLEAEEAGPAGNGDSAVTYASESISALAPVDLPPATKANIILGSYIRRSFLLSRLQEAYGDLRRTAVGTALGLPTWDHSDLSLGALASMNVLDLVEADLAHAGPGRAMFVHLLLPHFPYAFDADCGLRDPGSGWLTIVDKTLESVRLDEAGRDLRYPRYLDQVACTTARLEELLDILARQPWWEEAEVVVHGDHGSRLVPVHPHVGQREHFTDQLLIDGFSTLFAVKKPGVPAGYDRRQLPLGHLFTRTMKDGVDPGDPDLQARPRVMLYDGDSTMQEAAFPFFEHGEPSPPAAKGP